MTAQAHEKLILDGEETSMAFCPPLPEGHPRLVVFGDEEAEKSCPLCFSTACWRGYIGTWEIRNGRFFLVSVQGRFELEGCEPLFADWFSGVLRVSRGELLHYVHMGFGSVYEEELHIRIHEGVVVDSQVVSNREKQFDHDDLTWRNLPGNENRFDGDDEL